MRSKEFINEIKSNPNIDYHDEQDYSYYDEESWENNKLPEYKTRFTDSAGRRHVVNLSFSEEYGTLRFQFTVDDQLKLTKLDSVSAIRAFSAVQHILQENLHYIIEKHDIHAVVFGAVNEGNRISLYDRFVPYVSKILGNSFTFEPRPIENNGRYYVWRKTR
jgi:hypothetical protein